jgi:predicted MPP superfamily phosphohydrolase
VLVLAALLFLIVTAVFVWHAVRIAPHRLDVVRRALPVEGLPEALVGRTVLQISDVHAGGLMDDGYLSASFERLRALAPDFIVWTGDHVSFRFGDPLPRLAAVLHHAPRGRLGSFAVLGNHDYGSGHPWSVYHEHLAVAVCGVLEQAGITVLRNASRSVEGLAFIGLDELRSGRLDLQRAFADVPPGAPAIVLCHNPDAADRADWDGRRAWILSGHTHGGQVKPPFMAPPLTQVRNRRYTAGEAEAAPGRRVYVSRGIGYILPVRLGVPPEVTLFTLERA